VRKVLEGGVFDGAQLRDGVKTLVHGGV